MKTTIFRWECDYCKYTSETEMDKMPEGWVTILSDSGAIACPHCYTRIKSTFPNERTEKKSRIVPTSIFRWVSVKRNYPGPVTVSSTFGVEYRWALEQYWKKSDDPGDGEWHKVEVGG